MSHVKHHHYHHPSCLNCHYPLAEFDKFCPNCGQKPMLPKSSMHDLLHEFFHTFWHLDGKFFMTLHHLLIPGKLTTEFFKGHLKRYAHPIQLFLVLGAFAFGMLASKTAKIEKDTAESALERHDKYKRKAFLRELDSVRQSLIPPQYADSKTRLLGDSLMFKMIYPRGEEVDRDKLEKEISKILDAEFNKRHPNRKEDSIDIGNGGFKINYASDEIKEEREAFKDSILDGLMVLESTTSEKRLKETTVSDSNNNLKGNLKEFTDGIKDGIKQTDDERLLKTLRPKLEEQKRKRVLKDAIRIEKDSSGFGMFGKTMKIPTAELYELSPDSIIKKYEVQGYWRKIFTKQSIKATQEAGSLIHFYMSKLFWTTVIMIPILALFFSLVYWRKKRFYVEHIVFLLHFNTAAFLVLIPALWLSNYNSSVIKGYFIWFIIHFIASIKAYYQQSWGKTLGKSLLIGFAYFFMGGLFMTVAAFIGFIFF